MALRVLVRRLEVVEFLVQIGNIGFQFVGLGGEPLTDFAFRLMHKPEDDQPIFTTSTHVLQGLHLADAFIDICLFGQRL